MGGFLLCFGFLCMHVSNVPVVSGVLAIVTASGFYICHPSIYGVFARHSQVDTTETTGNLHVKVGKPYLICNHTCRLSGQGKSKTCLQYAPAQNLNFHNFSRSGVAWVFRVGVPLKDIGDGLPGMSGCICCTLSSSSKVSSVLRLTSLPNYPYLANGILPSTCLI